MTWVIARKAVLPVHDFESVLPFDVIEVVDLLRELADIQFQERLNGRYKMKPEIQVGKNNRRIDGDQREKVLAVQRQRLGEDILERRKRLQIGLWSSDVLDHGVTLAKPANL